MAVWTRQTVDGLHGSARDCRARDRVCSTEDGSYVAVLLNSIANAVDVAVEIRLSPAAHGRVRKL